MDDRSLNGGPDRRIPPAKKKSEGHACRARGKGMDDPTSSDGPNKQVPPRNRSQAHACRAPGKTSEIAKVGEG